MATPTPTVFTRSVAGHRPFSFPSTLFPWVSGHSPSPTSSSASTTRHLAGGSSHRSTSNSGETNSILAVVLPLFFGALIILAAIYAGLHWQRKRLKQREEATERQATKLRRVRNGGQSRAASGSFMLDLELDQKSVDLLEDLKIRDDFARLERSNSFKTHVLPRKPPPAYEA
ncbi:hypothetical protein JCM10213_006321 [Rhodosporidiobolus nylandii]